MDPRERYAAHRAATAKRDVIRYERDTARQEEDLLVLEKSILIENMNRIKRRT